MMLSVIVAMSEEGVIGRDGDLPWRLSADLRRFRRLTTPHTIIMGRKTYESIGRPLPDRQSVVISRNTDYQVDGVTVVSSLDAALAATESKEAFVIGGAEIFRLAIPQADRLYLTLVHASVEGDVHLPPLDLSCWDLRDEERHAADEKNQYDYSFLTYDRRAC
jgi:dihydrofolate reductase